MVRLDEKDSSFVEADRNEDLELEFRLEDLSREWIFDEFDEVVMV